ncbi:MAG TPA: SOS response-associated peptidase [Tepidisphaeraceae bacterium]|jgi:putative SOS response-associated peptidase YedK
MCGRYTLTKLADLLRLIPWLQAPADILEREARYNVAPSQVMPVVTADAVRVAQWGFVPGWAKEPPKVRPINARAETVAASGMFRTALAKRRCLVPADGFYEWKGSKPPKQPYLIRMRDGSPFAFAGLWERWKPTEGDPIETYTILTTAPNELMASIHNRMPVIIPVARYRDWLEGDTATELLQSYPAGEMEAFPVSSRVNSPKNDVPECRVPLG